MSHQDDSAYYWIRAAQELERADRAANAVAAAIHRDLAHRYGALAAQTETSKAMLDDEASISAPRESTSAATTVAQTSAAIS